MDDAHIILFPYSRVVSSDVAAAEGVVSLMKRFDWTRVAVVTQQETIFTSVRGLEINECTYYDIHVHYMIHSGFVSFFA